MSSNQSFFLYSDLLCLFVPASGEHAIKDKPVVLWVEEILLCLHVLNRPVVLVEKCKCTCAPLLKMLNRTFNSEWLVTDPKAFSGTRLNQPCFGGVYSLVIECKWHTFFFFFFDWLNSEINLKFISVVNFCCIVPNG